MADNPETSGPNLSRIISIITVIVISLPLLYVLSLGPAILVYKKVPLGVRATLISIYEPLGWATRHTFLEKPIQAYEKFWVEIAQHT